MDWITLAGLCLAVLGAGSTGAMFSPGPWYDALEKPGWTPPNWLFPLAWTALYIGMAWAAYRVAQAPVELAAPALAFWAAQIVLNATWSPMFFGLKNLGGALVILVFMWIAVVATTVLSFRADTLAGLLLVPYIVWVSYAGALNAVIWRNNPAQS